MDKQRIQAVTYRPKSKLLAQFLLCKVANKTWKREHKGKGDREEDKKWPIHDVPHPWHSRLECCSYVAASLESKKEERNMGNLSHKEGRSLFAVPKKRHKMTLPMNLHPLAGKLFFFSGQSMCSVAVNQISLTSSV